MVDVLRVERTIEDYISCWGPMRPKYSGIWEDNDFGCENLQIFRSGFNLEDFDHKELSYLATLLTRELRGQINQDHKFFWAWCSFLTVHFRSDVSLFGDGWSRSFRDLTHLALSGCRRSPAGPAYAKWLAEVLRYVNCHLLETGSNKWLIAGPLTFSVLEGLLRRKNETYVDADGTIRRRFRIFDSQGAQRSFNPSGRNRWLNRINDSLRCFEQRVTVDRGRICTHLQQMKTEIESLYSPPSGRDVYDLIDTWRNELMHGKEYWQNRVPILLNVICLLVIDEIDASLYDAQKADMRASIEWASKYLASIPYRAPWDLFPPDL